MGATFKENVSDIRNSKVVDVYNELKSFGLQVDVIDPYASSDEVNKYYNFSLVDEIANDYDTVIIAVNHDVYMEYDENYFKSIMRENGFLFDVKGSFKSKINELKYLSL